MPDMLIPRFVSESERFPVDIGSLLPWQVVGRIDNLVRSLLDGLPDDFRRTGAVAVHRSAVVI